MYDALEVIAAGCGAWCDVVCLPDVMKYFWQRDMKLAGVWIAVDLIIVPLDDVGCCGGGEVVGLAEEFLFVGEG